MMAGHGGDAVTWLSESLDGWETSSAFGGRRARRQGVRRREQHRRGLRKHLESSAAARAVSVSGCARRRSAAARVDGGLSARALGRRRQAGRELSRAVGAEPVCRSIPRTVRGGTRRVDGARQTRHDRRAGGEFFEPRPRRPRLRSAQPGSAGHVRAAGRHAGDAARSPGRARRPGRIRGRSERGPRRRRHPRTTAPKRQGRRAAQPADAERSRRGARAGGRRAGPLRGGGERPPHLLRAGHVREAHGCARGDRGGHQGAHRAAGHRSRVSKRGARHRHQRQRSAAARRVPELRERARAAI